MLFMNLNYIAIGKRIRNERLRRQLSQEKLAEMAEISPVHLSHIETANTKLSLPVLVNIANVLDVSADSLLCDSLSVSEKAYKHFIQRELEDCDKKELKLLSDSVKAIKASYRSL